MERKTIGSFIAALRRANGMTQKELAERVGVSDKTISRWECDDGAPDLSAIPVIAEIFGVSCDEILRGERKGASDSAEYTPAEAQKAEKQKSRLLSLALLSYKTNGYISLGIAGAGVLAAFICNTGFLKGAVGFFLGAAFILAAVIFQIIALKNVLFSVTSEEYDDAEAKKFKYTVTVFTEKVFITFAAFLAFIAPTLLGGAHAGLDIGSWLWTGAVCVGIMLIICAITVYFLNYTLVKKDFFTLPETEARVYIANFKFKRKCALITLAVIVVTAFLGLRIGAQLPYLFIKGIECGDYESFRRVMETPAARSSTSLSDDDKFGTEVIYTAPIDTTVPDYSEAVNEDYPKITLYDKDKNVVFECYKRNQNIAYFGYQRKDGGTSFPITVYTYDDVEKRNDIAAVITAVFIGICVLEAAGGIVVYNKKKAK